MDNPELERYLPIAKMIGRSLGKNCEVVLHDLTRPHNSVVYVANSHVTGRRLGQSFDRLIKKLLLKPELIDDQRCNYVYTADNGNTVKSSTVLLRDHNAKVIGAMCINVDISAVQKAADVLQSIISPMDETEQEKAPEPELSNVGDVLDAIIDSIIAETDSQNASRRQRLEMISFMDGKGVFLVKGSVEKVADRMGISAVTVYSYLDEVRKKARQENSGESAE